VFSGCGVFFRSSDVEAIKPDIAGHETGGRTVDRKLKGARRFEQSRSVEAAQETKSR